MTVAELIRRLHLLPPHKEVRFLADGASPAQAVSLNDAVHYPEYAAGEAAEEYVLSRDEENALLKQVHLLGQ